MSLAPRVCYGRVCALRTPRRLVCAWAAVGAALLLAALGWRVHARHRRSAVHRQAVRAIRDTRREPTLHINTPRPHNMSRVTLNFSTTSRHKRMFLNSTSHAATLNIKHNSVLQVYEKKKSGISSSKPNSSDALEEMELINVSTWNESKWPQVSSTVRLGVGGTAQNCDSWAILFSYNGISAALSGRTSFTRAKVSVPSGYIPCWSADPFVANGVVFAEIYKGSYGTPDGKGQIGAAKLIEGSLNFVPAIIEDWHLSYPWVFQSGQDVFVLPEQYRSKRQNVMMYNCTSLPCSRYKELEGISPRRLIDFAFVPPNCLSATDQRTKKREGSTWRQSDSDPIRSDYTQTTLESKMFTAVNEYRGAGAVLETQLGRLLPVQSNGKVYGKSVFLYDIVSWTRITQIEVPAESGYCGIHHISVDPCNPKLVVVDVKGPFNGRKAWC